ncbi:MAG TPA: hypothetical protein VN946_02775 [Terriglobales bacterium]|jgi:hypothetical protein|nr:hypothetical protein [Terriglobales bacterium]
MSDEILNHGHTNEADFEHEDLGSRGLFVFMISLVISGVVIYFIIYGMYRFLDKYESSQMTTASPLIANPGVVTRVVTQADMDKAFKDNGAPMLETNERGQFRDFLLNQEDQLNSYGWVNKDAGVAHIPIERAMDLLVQEKLPVYPQSAADASATSKAPAAK